MVTALLGTVRTKFTESPRYSALHPSLTTILLAVRITPGVASGGVAGFPLNSGLRSVCKRVRITSCGYVTIDAVILDIAEHWRNCVGVKDSGERPWPAGDRNRKLSDLL